MTDLNVLVARPPQEIMDQAATAAPGVVTLAHCGHYVGLAYQEGVFDCADLTALVLREQFGKKLSLPPHAARPRGVAGQRREMLALSAQLGVRLAQPVHGCVVLMQSPVLDTGAMGWHMGLVLVEAGAMWVLHNTRRMGGVVLQQLADLQRMGTQAEGYYACL